MASKVFITILYLFFFVSGSLFSLTRNTLIFNGNMLAEMADVKTGVTELSMVRAGLVLALSSSAGYRTVSGTHSASAPDMALSFDEGHPLLFRDSAGRYRVFAAPSVEAVDRRFARAGQGAALFSGTALSREPAAAGAVRGPAGFSSGGLRLEPGTAAALFSPNNRFGDFSLEFWLHPLIMENGEQVFLWTSSLPDMPSAAGSVFQRVLAVSSRNRLQWSFLNFFISPDGRNSIDITLTGHSAIVPGTWSHHLIRFDSTTGMIEYLVNGNSEAIDYATSTRREGGEVFTPRTGVSGNFVIGGSFNGLMDEFKIHASYISGPPIRRYPLHGGRIETRAIDLGEGNNNIIGIEASGGRTSVVNSRISSEHRRNGRFLFSDDSEMQFFIRSSNNPFRWDTQWMPVIPGTEFGRGVIQGRYVQLAVDFYPSADGESTPFLEEVRIVFYPDEPPMPPAGLVAVAMDGAVRLTWRHSPSPNTQGYLVFYGTASDSGIASIFFGEGATLGASPIDVGKTNSVTITGLQNGTLYFFRVAAYSNRDERAVFSRTGEFSREVRARPLAGLGAP